MTRKQAFCLLLAGSMTVLNGGSAWSQDNAKKPHVPLEKTVGQVTQKGPLASLLVINSDGATLEGEKLVLTGVAASAIVFADRPVRAAGHVSTDEIVRQWGQGPDNFESDPPNATISVLGGGTDVSDAVVTLKAPTLEGTTLTFDVTVLEGSLAGASGPAALFVDHWRGWNNAGWYGVGLATGAVLGAAAAEPRYYEPRPYYPPVVGNPCPPGYWIGPWGHCRDTPYHGRLPNGGWQ